MKRIEVIGCSGGGKSTLARAIGAKLGLPVIHIDQLIWTPGWVLHPDRLARILAASAREARVLDGTSPGTFAQRFPVTDLVVWVDQPPTVCVWRVFRRWVSHLGRNRIDMAPGCPERFELDFLTYIWTFRCKVSPRIQAALTQYRPRFVRLRSNREVEAFLAGL